MQIVFAPIWWKSAAMWLALSSVWVATGLLSLFRQSGPPDLVFGALAMFLGGMSLTEAAFRFRAARSAQN